MCHGHLLRCLARWGLVSLFKNAPPVSAVLDLTIGRMTVSSLLRSALHAVLRGLERAYTEEVLGDRLFRH
jgi:hypothetical protein